MILDLDKETIGFICRHKLTFTQYAICLLIKKKDVATIIQISEEVGRIGDCLIPMGDNKYKNEMDDLIDRGYIVHNSVDKKDFYNLDNFQITKLFTKDLEPLQTAADEFFETYPKKGIINGVEYHACTCDYEEMKEKYMLAIKNSIRKHQEIINKLNNFKQNNTYATMNIMKFIGGRVWDQMEEQNKVRTRGH